MATNGWGQVSLPAGTSRVTPSGGRDRGQRQGAKRCWVTPDRALVPYLEGEPKPAGAHFFQSLKEARRWLELLILRDHGHIRNLDRQVAIPLSTCGVVIGKYLADAIYEEFRDGRWHKVVEDTKPSGGFRQDLYLWKRAHVLAEHGITIREV